MDIGEKNVKSETKSQQQESSADFGVRTFVRKKSREKGQRAKLLRMKACKLR